MSPDPTYGNSLRDLITNPNSFQGTPGFQFALNNGMDAVARSAAARGFNGSGNMAGDLTKYATGLASQNYMDYAKMLGGFSGQEQNYDLGLKNYDLGKINAGNAATRNANDLTLGLGANANQAQANSNTANRDWWDYLINGQRNANDAAGQQNQFDLGMYNAQTNRAGQQSTAYNQGQNTLLDWTKFGYQLNPAQRTAGVPGTSGGGWNGVG